MAEDCNCSSSMPATEPATVTAPLPESRRRSLLEPVIPCKLTMAPVEAEPVVAIETKAPAIAVESVMLLSKLMEPPEVVRESRRVTAPAPVWLKPKPATAPVVIACRLMGLSDCKLTEPPVTTWPLKVRAPAIEVATRFPARMALAEPRVTMPPSSVAFCRRLPEPAEKAVEEPTRRVEPAFRARLLVWPLVENKPVVPPVIVRLPEASTKRLPPST